MPIPYDEPAYSLGNTAIHNFHHDITNETQDKKRNGPARLEERRELIGLLDYCEKKYTHDRVIYYTGAAEVYFAAEERGAEHCKPSVNALFCQTKTLKGQKRKTKQ